MFFADVSFDATDQCHQLSLTFFASASELRAGQSVFGRSAAFSFARGAFSPV